MKKKALFRPETTNIGRELGGGDHTHIYIYIYIYTFTCMDRLASCLSKLAGTGFGILALVDAVSEFCPSVQAASPRSDLRGRYLGTPPAWHLRGRVLLRRSILSWLVGHLQVEKRLAACMLACLHACMLAFKSVYSLRTSCKGHRRKASALCNRNHGPTTALAGVILGILGSLTP